LLQTTQSANTGDSIIKRRALKIVRKMKRLMIIPKEFFINFVVYPSNP